VKFLNYVVTLASLVARNLNDALVEPVLGSGGVCACGGLFGAGAFGRNLASVLKMFSHLISPKRNVIHIVF
jgi:hypothetical protein